MIYYQKLSFNFQIRDYNEFRIKIIKHGELMTDNDILIKIEKKADDMLKEHNGVYLEKQLYNLLKSKFPSLTRTDFKEVLDKLLEENYSMECGLIRPKAKETKRSSDKYTDDSKPGKGTADHQRIPDKRL